MSFRTQRPPHPFFPRRACPREHGSRNPSPSSPSRVLAHAGTHPPPLPSTPVGATLGHSERYSREEPALREHSPSPPVRGTLVAPPYCEMSFRTPCPRACGDPSPSPPFCPRRGDPCGCPSPPTAKCHSERNEAPTPPVIPAKSLPFVNMGAGTHPPRPPPVVLAHAGTHPPPLPSAP